MPNIPIDEIKRSDTYKDFCAHVELIKERGGQLFESIKKHGILIPIVLDDAKNLLDGFSRVAICEILDIKEIPYVTRTSCGRRNTGVQLHSRETTEACSCDEEGRTPVA